MDASTIGLDTPPPTGGRTNGTNGTGEPLDVGVARAYDELRAIAHTRLSARNDHDTLSTTALVHEAYLKLRSQSGSGHFDLPHLLAVSSLAMRHVLVDRARERVAIKRGGSERHVITLDEEELGADDQAEALLQINDALDRLAAWNDRLARVVECRFFGGLTESETATALGLTVRTVQRDWIKARVVLRRALEP
jgi:RNA polymerase sigma factor (TIGR02999 family)